MGRRTSNVILLGLLLVGLLTTGLLRGFAQAAEPPSGFSLQVTPSPLVATVTPGKPITLELKVRNGGSGTENLRIEPRSFKLDSTSGEISIDDTASAEITPWTTFSSPTFSVAPGQWYSQKITLNVPKDAGFSYSFALIISRKDTPQPVSSGRLIKGSLAVFTLVNVDRPGSTRKLEVPKFVSDHGIYEQLPATFTIQFKNTGNSIVQPYGNIYVERGEGSEKPLATLKVNETKAYMLPGTTREITATWEKTSDFRFGKFSAKLVAVYNDGSRDMPIEARVTFWVIPWRLILLAISTIIVLWLIGRWRTRRRIDKAVERALHAQSEK